YGRDCGRDVCPCREEAARFRGAQIGALLAAGSDQRVGETVRPAASARFGTSDPAFRCAQHGAHARAGPGRATGSEAKGRRPRASAWRLWLTRLRALRASPARITATILPQPTPASAL